MQRGTGSKPHMGTHRETGDFLAPDGSCRFWGCSPSAAWVGTAAAEAPIPAPSPGEPPATILSLNFEGLDTIAPTVTVPVGTSVTPVATLAGVNASHATGTVTYSVYLDNQCQTPAEPPVVETIATPGVLPPAPEWCSGRERITGARRTPPAANCRNSTSRRRPLVESPVSRI